MKTIIKFLIVLVTIVELVLTADDSEWSYDDQGNWKCNATKLRQSPIDIVTKDVICQSDWNLKFTNYAQEVDFNIRNTNHSVSLTPRIRPNQRIPLVNVNWVDGGCDYELKEIHFHWGDGIKKGSEHEIDNQKAAAEMHMVHYRKGIDGSQIGNVENSVVVVGVFIESDNIDHNKLEGLISSTSKVNGTDEESTSDRPEFLINLLPDNRESFFTYNGSLTTPPCYEVVTWILMSQPVYMRQDKLIDLTNFANELNEEIGPNNRDIQPLLNRPVYSSYNVSTAISTKRLADRISSSGFTATLERYVPKFRRFEQVAIDQALSAINRILKFLIFSSPSSS